MTTSTIFQRSRCRVGRLLLGVLLLALPACGLSEYEALMHEAQQREQRFRDEQKYLDEPVKVPTRKDKEGHEVSVGDVFFRPPKGIQLKCQSQPRNEMLWQYPSLTKGGDFDLMEMAFATDDKEFAGKVLKNYTANVRAEDKPREFPLPNRETPLVFDVWEFDNGQEGYSINVLRGAVPQVAVVFVYRKARRADLRKAMDLSLESLAVGSEASAARQKFERKSPWNLRGTYAP